MAIRPGLACAYPTLCTAIGVILLLLVIWAVAAFIKQVWLHRNDK
ncbi:hypothetical protein [Candidatus Reidiella endopervernicosa]|nr:hypothetical protein [Candidatus Reidiella endopervernicosa]